MRHILLTNLYKIEKTIILASLYKIYYISFYNFYFILVFHCKFLHFVIFILVKSKIKGNFWKKLNLIRKGNVANKNKYCFIYKI